MKTPRVGVLGMGRFGTRLAYSLTALGLEVRSYTRVTPLAAWVAACDVLCLACRDDQLPHVIAEVAAHGPADKLVLMHSGATPLAEMEPLVRAGARVGKFHPLMAFTEAEAARIPPGTSFAVEGAAAPVVAPWVAAWQGKMYPLEGDQWRRYHLAAVTAANFLPLLIRAGADLLAPFAQDRGDALAWLAPLVRQTVAGALDAERDLPYSGPAVRGDARVVAAQAAQWAEEDPAMAEIYRRLSEAVMRAAQRS